MSCPAVIEVITPGPPGPVGPTGPAGVSSAWLQGAGVPSGGTGAEGDFYLDTETGDIYGPLTDGDWGLMVFNIAEGQTGPKGDPGDPAPGTDLNYDASTRLLSSSTGQDVTLPLAGADPGLLGGASFSGPSGWTASGSVSGGNVTLSLSLPAGFGLLSSADQSKLTGIASGATANATDAQLRDRSTHTGTQAVGTITGLAAVATSGAYSDLSGRPTLGSAAATETTAYATAAQGAKADTAVQPAGLSVYVQTGDARLSDSREWSAATIDQAEAEAGTATTRRAFTAQRVFQAAAAWWAASSARTKLDGIASGATNTPLSDAAPQSPGTAAAGTSNSAARGDHVHPLPATVSTSAAGLARATGYGTITYAAQVTLDFSSLAGQMNTISLTGNLELLASNLANGREVRLRLVCDSTQRNLTFPVNWKFVGTKPANIAASKVAILSLAAFGTTDADVVAAYAVQS